MDTLEKEIIEKSSLDISSNKSFDSQMRLNNMATDTKNRYFENIKAMSDTYYVFDFFKRCFDVIISFLLLVLTIPLVLFVAILIKIETKGPVLYKQERLGEKNKQFTIYKLRSMYSDAEKDGARWAIRNDTRITRIGGIIRKTRIDELPQLINVLKGEMSLIGPRPERKIFADQFIKTDEQFSNRTLVKPGLTGLAQVNGGYDLSPFEKLEYDLDYIKNRNFKMEMKIVMITVKVIFTGEGAR